MATNKTLSDVLTRDHRIAVMAVLPLISNLRTETRILVGKDSRSPAAVWFHLERVFNGQDRLAFEVSLALQDIRITVARIDLFTQSINFDFLPPDESVVPQDRAGKMLLGVWAMLFDHRKRINPNWTEDVPRFSVLRTEHRTIWFHKRDLVQRACTYPHQAIACPVQLHGSSWRAFPVHVLDSDAQYMSAEDCVSSYTAANWGSLVVVGQCDKAFGEVAVQRRREFLADTLALLKNEPTATPLPLTQCQLRLMHDMFGVHVARALWSLTVEASHNLAQTLISASEKHVRDFLSNTAHASRVRPIGRALDERYPRF